LITQALFESARTDSRSGDGALLGAMLKVRMGAQLPAHVKSLIHKLETIQISPTVPLSSAFAFVAAMHQAGQAYLSREVLAQVLGLTPGELHARVLFPLAREAAATGGTFISTRHRTIAETAVRLFEQDFGIDTGDLFVQLAGAAEEARQSGWIPELQKWEFSLPAYFSRRDPGLAVRIGRRLLSVRPSDLHLATNLARLYRESGDPVAASNMLSGYLGTTIDNRAFWFELGASSGGTEKSSLWLLLAMWSIADQRGVASPSVLHASIVLPGIALAFKTLHEKYLLPAFKAAQIAACRLGLTVAKRGEDTQYLLALLPTNAPTDKELKVSTVEALMAELRTATAEAIGFEPVVTPLTLDIPDPKLMGFQGIIGIIGRAAAELEP
jgi:hypothetical protein